MAPINRRAFLKTSGTVASLASLGLLRPKLLFSQGQSEGNGRNYVQINFVGGYDSLAVMPYYDGPVSDYLESVRPNIFVPRDQVIPVTNMAGIPNKIGLHPLWSDFATAAEGHIKICQMTGTRNYRGGSHNLLQQIHSRGVDNPEYSEQRGLLGRISEENKWQLFQAWGLGGGNRLDFRTNNADYKPLVIGSNLGNFDFKNRHSSTVSIQGISGFNTSREYQYFANIREQFLSMNNPEGELADLLNQGLSTTKDAIETVKVINNSYPNGNYGENAFGRMCRALSKILKYQSDNPEWESKSLIAYMQQGGFDTHGNQGSALNNHLDTVADNLAILVEDLKSHNGGAPWLNTTFNIVTDFGRTTKENNGLGSDHAWAYSNMIFGGRVTAGVISSPPPMSDLQTGNRLAVTDIEYRTIIGNILQDMAIDPQTVFTEQNYEHKNIGLYI